MNVTDSSKWPFCGYNEIQNSKQRYSLIDDESLMGILYIWKLEEMKGSYRGWVEKELTERDQGRQPRWVEGFTL